MLISKLSHLAWCYFRLVCYLLIVYISFGIFACGYISSDVLLYLIFANFDTLRLFSIFGFQGTNCYFEDLLTFNGDGEIRTLDPLLARQVLSQLSYTPI